MIDRRSVLKGLVAIPIVAAAGGFATALLSYLRPTLKPLQFPTPEKPLNKDLVAGSLSEFPQPYAFKEFIFSQETVEYTSRGKQQTNVPGYIVRIPDGKVPASVGDAGGGLRRGYAVTQYQGQTYNMVVVSRICAHLGCIFQYHTPQEVCQSFNYCGGKNNMFSCPCHLSVYDPTQVGYGNGVPLPGLVVSGPAPRPPFPFDFVIDGDKIVIKGYS
ncbi:MAG TPA: hypothetical protein VHN99_03930 [Deinococcales bacterium]|nr:hypothetical protein [Deinococcales bacterium]